MAVNRWNLNAIKGLATGGVPRGINELRLVFVGRAAYQRETFATDLLRMRRGRPEIAELDDLQYLLGDAHNGKRGSA